MCILIYEHFYLDKIYLSLKKQQRGSHKIVLSTFVKHYIYTGHEIKTNHKRIS